MANWLYLIGSLFFVTGTIWNLLHPHQEIMTSIELDPVNLYTQAEKQAFFDKIAVHLLTQNAKSTRGKLCAYRGTEDRKCAIGCLIPDERYNLDLEGHSVHSLSIRAAAGLPGLLHFSLRDLFLGSLQSIHDNHEPPFWYLALYDFASEHNLSVKVLKQFKPAKQKEREVWS